MTPQRFRGNIPHNVFTADTLHDILQEQRETNKLLQKLVDEILAEGPAETIGRVFDGRKKRK